MKAARLEGPVPEGESSAESLEAIISCKGLQRVEPIHVYEHVHALSA